MGVVGELVVLIAGNNTLLTSSLVKSEAELKAFSATAGTHTGLIAGAMRGVGVAGLAIGASVAVGTAVAVKAAGDFQDQMAIINTIAHQTPEELAKTGDGIRALATSTGEPLDTMTSAFYDLLSAGVKSGDAMRVLQLSTTLGIGALASTKETVDLLTTAINSYHLTTSQAARVTDMFALAVQDGKVTAAQISSTFADVAPLAAQMKIGIDEVSATYAVLTSRGVPAAEAMTQMNRAMVELQKPNADLQGLMDKTHLNFAKIAGEKGLVVALETMRKAAEENGVPFQNLFGRLEGFKFALATTGPNFATYGAELEKMHNANGTAAAQAEERMGTFNRQVAILGNTFGDLLISVGGPLLPAFTALVSAIASGVTAITDWVSQSGVMKSIMEGLAQAGDLLRAGLGVAGDAIRTAASAIASFASSDTARPILMGIAEALRNIATFVGQAVTGFVQFVTSASGQAQILGAVRTVVQGLGTAFDFVRTAIATVAGWFQNFLQHLTGTTTASASTSTALSGLAGFLSQVANFLATVVTRLAQFAFQVIDGANKMGVFKVIGDVINGVFGFMGDALRILIQFVGLLATGISGTLSSAFLAIQNIIGAVTGAINAAIEAIKGLIKGAQEAVAAVASIPGVKLVGDVAGGAAGVAGNVINGIAGALPHFDMGGVVPGAGPQLVVAHGGEGVFTPSQVAALTGGRSGGGGAETTVHQHRVIQVVVDRRVIAEILDEELLKLASGYSSGLVASPGITGA